MKRIVIIAGAVASAVALCPRPVAAADARRPVRAEDLLAVKLIANAAISHDGARVAFVVTRLDAAKDTYLSNIWLANVRTGEVRQLTRGDSDSGPAWSPDDRSLAFVSGRAEKAQIFRIDLDGGEARKLTDAAEGAAGPVWSHDGSRIAFASDEVDAARPRQVDWHAAGVTPTDKQRKTDVRRIDSLFFSANGAGYTYDRRAHIWTVRADGTGMHRVTGGRPWSERNYIWSADDASIVFNSYRAVDVDAFRDDVYVVAASGGAMRKLPLAHAANDAPTLSHDGRLWYFVTSHPDPAGYPGVAVADAAGAHERVVVPENTVAFGDAVLTDQREGGAGCGPIFEPQDRWFVADVSREGRTELVRFDAQTGAPQRVVAAGGEIVDCSMSADGSRIAFVRSDATHPAELFVVDGAGEPRQLSHLNAEYASSVALSQPERFSVRDDAGFQVAAWFMRPPNAAAGRRYPTILDIHGGPGAEFADSFFHEFQYLASLGYNVVYADPRGSAGFGYPFQAALSKDWSAPMYDDLSRVVDAVSSRPDVDTSRLGVSGGSYGGYATLWMIGHTKRFKAAVAERVASNLGTLLTTADFAGNTDAKYSWGNPWDHPATMQRQSPVTYVKQMTTPLLLIHSEDDLRTPVGDTLQIYNPLKVLGREVVYVTFPGENHDLSRTGKPLHRIERLHIIADWFAKYLRP